MDIRVTDTAKEDLYLDIVFTGITPLDRERGKG
jgi:hypothetical protein